MIVEEGLARLAPDLADDYLTVAQRRGGPKAVEKTALRTRSTIARDLLAYAAAPGHHTTRELIAMIRAGAAIALQAGDPAASAPSLRPPSLDLDWTVSLARVIGMQNLEESDLSDAVLLLEELRRQHGPSAFDRAAQQTIVDRLWQAGEYDLLRSRLRELRRLKPDVLRSVRADLTNPFIHHDGISRKARTRRLAAWHRQVKKIFANYGVEPITVTDGMATAFDGLTCDVRDRVTSGPLVSVIMTTFRPGAELVTSVQSICHQTWQNLEILIMDDASGPDYDDILDSCAALDPRVRVRRLEHNGGTYLARNAALDIATGVFVTCQDSDDWSHPRRIEAQVNPLLADPTTPATRSFCFRVSPDLVFQRPGYEISQENASSLMFRREQALATVGYFDSSRRGADTEFRRRLELATGSVTTDLPAPLTMVRMAPGSLSRSDFIPGWHHASRFLYRSAYEAWHAKLRSGADPYLPRFQETRQFAVPPQFQVDQLALANQPPHYDVVLLGDWRQYGPTQRSMIDEIHALTRAGYRVGIAHMESYQLMTRRRTPMCAQVLELINNGTVDFVALDQAAAVRLLVIRTPVVLQFAPSATSTLDIDQVVVMADCAPHAIDETSRQYTAATCDAAARDLFHAEPLWIPQSPAIRSMLAEALPAHRLHSLGSPGVVDADAWYVSCDADGENRSVPGQHVPDRHMKSSTYLTQIADLVGPPRPAGLPGGGRNVVGPHHPKQTRPRREVLSVGIAAKGSEDVSLILLVRESAAVRLSTTLAHIRDSEVLHGIPVSVVYPPAAQLDVDIANAAPDAPAFIPAEDDSRESLANAARDQLAGTHARYVCIANLPREQDVRRWSSAVQREIERLGLTTLVSRQHGGSTMPLLVWTDHCTTEVVAAYIHHVLTTTKVGPGALADFLAGLALAAGSPRLEAADPHGGDVELLAWLAAKLAPDLPEPPWRYRFVLSSSEGVIRSQPITLTPRVNSRGKLVWENLRARLPLDEAADSNYTLALEVYTRDPELQTSHEVRPAKGALLNARTVAMPIRHEDSTGVTRRGNAMLRYLVHATGGNKATYITTQTGRGPAARLHWAATLVRKDFGRLLRGRGSRRMSLLRLVRLVTRPFFAKKQIWLIGERTDTAQDNGHHLFRHLRQTHPKRHVYYVIDESSPQYERIAGLGHVVAHSSRRHQLLMLHATVLANAYSIRYLTPETWGQANYVQHLAWRIGAFRVYLKHGVHLSPSAVKRGLSGYDLFLTVMPRETQALRAVSGYDSQLAEIGMPRYDGLIPSPRSGTVLFMPTWRQYLVPRLSGKAHADQIPFEGSAYERFMSGFLNSPRLHDMLEKYDYRLSFLPHYNMAAYFDADVQAADRIDVADTNATSFQDLLRCCDAFITDYSSVHFDVAYLGTPIIYVRFDDEDYETRHASPSWFDYEHDGFGPVTHTLDDALDALQRTLEEDCAVAAEYAKRVDATFTFRDMENSARTVAAIDKLIRR